MAAPTVASRPRHTSSTTARIGKKSGYWFDRLRGRAFGDEPGAETPTEHSTYPNPGADTTILPAVPSAPGVEVVEHFSPAQLNLVPVLSAISEDAARATGGKISPQTASALLHKHLAALDWRIAQTRRGALNLHEAVADAVNLTAADEAAARVGARVVVDSRAMVETILKRADMRSNPEMPTQSFANVSAATEFPAPMDVDRPTIGKQHPARDLGAGDFVLDVDDTAARDPLSMWRLVERVEALDGRVVAVLATGRSLGFAPDEPVWLLPPLEGRRQRDAAGDGRVPEPVAAEVKPAIPEGEQPDPKPLPRRRSAASVNGRVAS